MKRWLPTLPVFVFSLSAFADSSGSSLWEQRKPVAPKATVAPQGYSGLGAESLTPDLIAKFAAPALPREVTRRIQAMLDVRGAGTGLVTAKGDRMYFTSAVTGQPQVWRQDGPMKLAIQMTGGEDRTSVVDIAPDESWLVVSRDIGGEENPGIYLMKASGGPLEVVQHRSKVQTSLMYIADDSKSLFFRANDVKPDSYAIYRYDIAAKKSELVFDQPGLWSIADRKGTQWLMVNQLGNAQNEVFTYDITTKKLAPVLGQNEVEEYQVRFGAKAGEILATSNKLGDFRRLYRVDLVSGAGLVPISPDVKHDVEGFLIDYARKRIYYHLNESGYRKLRVLDAKTYKELALPTLPDAENVSFGGATNNGRFIQLSVDGGTLAPTSVTYDWQTRKATVWRVPTTPEIDATSFAKATLESYPARDGTQIPMFVRRPARCTEPCPVIVDFHGGPEGQSTAGFASTAQLFVDAGFVFVQPNVRGSSGYGKAWLHADDGPKRLAVVTDIEDAAKYIRTAWAKNGKAPKIGVMGGSYGGYSTLMAMTYFAGSYEAGVQIVGISNLTTFLMNTAPYRRKLRISEYGDPVKDKDALVTLSPITHVDKLAAPLLSIQGVNDPRVPVGEAIQIYREAERRKIPGGLILFPDEGHGATKRENKVAQLGHTIAFFRKYLQPAM
ncbi:MAG: prolyl oligopeptidase family serine peptidase [Kofleriaceae bacterium]